MSEIVYAVHTRACTYLLDEDGFCRWVLSRSGARSDDRCVGAQFVAALDLRSKGGLVGELRIGAQALFIRHEDGRFALIRTKPIEHVEIRGEGDSEGTFDPPADEAPAHGSLPSYSAQGYGAQSHGAHGYGAESPSYEEPEPVVLPDRLAVAAVFNAPAPAPEPEPPSARVILQTPSPYAHHTPEPPAYAHHAPPPAYAPPAYVAPRTEPPPRPEPPPRVEPPPPAPPARAFPQAPPRERARRREDRSEPPPEPAFPSAAHAFAEAHARTVDRSHKAPHDARESYHPATRAAFPRAAEPPRGFPAPPPRAAVRPRDPSTETQPLPSMDTAPLPPTGRVPAWPAMLAPPPPQAEMMPLGPARAALPSAEELSVDDLEEVGDDDQVYSMEVTLTLPLYRGDQNLAGYFPKRSPK